MKKEKKINNYLSSIIFFIVFIFVLILVVTNLSFGFDSWLNQNFANLQSLTLTYVMMFFTMIGDWYSMIILSLILLTFFYVLKKKKNALFFVVCMVGGYLLSESLKFIIQKDRPESTILLETGYSFPSQHAMMSAIFFLVLLYCFKDNLKNKILKNLFIAACIFMFLAIGLSRIYLGVHYFSDVIAGFALGIALVNFIMLKFFEK